MRLLLGICTFKCGFSHRVYVARYVSNLLKTISVYTCIRYIMKNSVSGIWYFITRVEDFSEEISRMLHEILVSGNSPFLLFIMHWRFNVLSDLISADCNPIYCQYDNMCERNYARWRKRKSKKWNCVVKLCNYVRKWGAVIERQNNC